MNYCNKCKHTLEEGTQFCPYCGAHVNAGPIISEDSYDPQDVQSNKGLAFLSYFGILFLIPLFVRKDSKFVRFHLNQGLVLFIIDIIMNILHRICNYLFVLYIIPSLSFGVKTLLFACDVFTVVLTIMGMVYALQGKAKELPIIGKINLIKN